jgi:molybdate/tungstate transport system ATP-binding protein
MLRIKNIRTKFDEFELNVQNLHIREGDYYVLAGPSGSGKTILLEMIAGIYKTRKPGQIIMNGVDITHLSIQQRNIGMVFQDNTLFPHFTVKKNIEFALKQKNKNREIHQRIRELTHQFNIENLLARDPKTLSGGEIQRVLLARTLASVPDILLLDEPLSAVDSHQKDHLKSLLRNLNRSGQTIIHVTHDFEEAFSLATKMGIMHRGAIVENGNPVEILKNPANAFVARFCGYRNYFEDGVAEQEYILINDVIKLKFTTGKTNQGKCGVLIDESKIEVHAIQDTLGNENVFSGIIKDSWRSIKGREFRIDMGIMVVATISQESRAGKNFKTGDPVKIFIKDHAITLISR